MPILHKSLAVDMKSSESQISGALKREPVEDFWCERENPESCKNHLSDKAKTERIRSNLAASIEIHKNIATANKDSIYKKVYHIFSLVKPGNVTMYQVLGVKIASGAGDSSRNLNKFLY